jgi:hypothetical protein
MCVRVCVLVWAVCVYVWCVCEGGGCTGLVTVPHNRSPVNTTVNLQALQNDRNFLRNGALFSRTAQCETGTLCARVCTATNMW